MLINKLKNSLSNQFLRNVGWLGASELVNRVFRLGTTVTLARVFSPQDYGLMAVIYTIFDLVTVFIFKGGIGAKVIQAEEEQVATIASTSYWLNWIVCIALFLVQCLAAWPIAQFYDNNKLILPICAISLMYLIYPFFLTHCALIERENRLKIIAMCTASQSIVSNIFTVIFALVGMGIWAIVIPMLITVPVWFIFSWRNHTWRPPKSFSLEDWQMIVNYGKNLIGVELLTKLRLNLDYLIVGKFLGVEQLGLYYFAFNAGSGITNNIVNSLMSALFPHLCGARGDRQDLKKRYFKSLKTISLTVIPIVILQSALSPFYVPIIFGEKWVKAIPILILICLSVVPMTFKHAASLLLNSIDQTHISLYFDLIYTIIFALAIFISVQQGILAVAITVLAINLLFSLTFSIYSSQMIFAKKI
ncbi:lipopolysaccharide biosynthesis protein [Pleurocapsa sp. CCALA 161]|uniref:lipopolysaccharide biosynthesis protein n=1 Tax=Pleurocapsa sp. CCALA 161 TaxID=2107688 RepID=UPI000D0771B7|nr:lipopolysaccharide biosynthesis protein [Pleurocapsa sp. CCALA 161]PSB10598.1 lipopolysaccharide biosynthesis protein [Pleurocapsa sp. CCALA 161]